MSTYLAIGNDDRVWCVHAYDDDAARALIANCGGYGDGDELELVNLTRRYPPGGAAVCLTDRLGIKRTP